MECEQKRRGSSWGVGGRYIQEKRPWLHAINCNDAQGGVKCILCDVVVGYRLGNCCGGCGGCGYRGLDGRTNPHLATRSPAAHQDQLLFFGGVIYFDSRRDSFAELCLRT